MAHWEELNSSNKVVNVLVGDNNEPDEGYQWLIDNLGGRWIKTSYNGNIRKNFAGIGFTYDEERDAFIPPKPYPSWTLNEETCQWEPPVPFPSGFHIWNEANQTWEEVDNAN